VKIATDPETKKSRGFGFLSYHYPESACRAIEVVNGF